MTEARVRSGGRRRRAIGCLAGILAAAPSVPAAPPVSASPQGAAPAPAASEKPLFVDAAETAGLKFRHVHGGSGTKYIVETMGSGACWLDFDRDGLADLFFVNGAPLPGFKGETPRDALFRNAGGGRFEEVTARAGITDPGPWPGKAGYGMGCAAGDVDNDGDLDLYVTSLGPNILYRNNGDGTFTDVTARAGVGDERWGASAAFADYDGDGWLDLYVANYLDFTVEKNVYCGDWRRGLRSYCHPDAYPSPVHVLYRNRGDGTFEDATAKAGVRRTDGKGMGVVWGDYDNDGDVDLYVANDSTPNFLFMNNGDGTFRDATLSGGAAFSEEGKTQAGMGTDAGDYDGDGDLDLFVTNLDMENNALYRNSGRGTFEDQSFPAGVAEPSFMMVGFGTRFIDFDNDADFDILVGNGHILDDIHLYNEVVSYEQPAQLYENAGGRFRERAAGPALARRAVVRGLATSDYDGDGDVDVAVSENNRPARLWRNEAGGGRVWLQVDLAARRGNPHGIGARVTVSAGGRKQLQEVRSGASYCSQSDLRLHFGLGGEARYDWIEVRWPSGGRERFGGGEARRVVRLEEGKGGPASAPGAGAIPPVPPARQ